MSRGETRDPPGGRQAVLQRTANVLPDPAIDLSRVHPSRKNLPMAFDGDTAFEALRQQIEAAANGEGRTALPCPGIYVIRSCQQLVRKKSWSPTPSLGVIVQGQKRVFIRGQELVYRPQQYLVVTGEYDYEASIQQVSARRPYLSLSIMLDPALVARLMIALSDTDSAQNEQLTPSPGAQSKQTAAYVSQLDPTLTDTLLRLMRALQDPAEQRILAPLILEELAFRLLRSESAALLRKVASRGGDQRRLQDAIDYIRDHVTENLTVPELARQCAMSPSHFAHRFRDLVRVSPMQYVKHVRLTQARWLMLHEGLRPAEAAAASGYASISHFSRDFKRHFDEPPAQHIARIRGRFDLDSSSPNSANV